MSANSRRLILFTRYPTPGVTKTRLIPELGENGAANLQRKMTEQMLQTAQAVAKQLQLDIYIYFSDGTKELMQDWLGTDLFFVKQQDGDLGHRMTSAFADARRNHAVSAVLIGCDIPGITENIILHAFQALEQNAVVLGPTLDGGYYLIGMTLNKYGALKKKLFADIPWSTALVYKTTARRLKKAQDSFTTLEKLRDIDRPEDLVHLRF